jgi:CBS domain-containing protein
MRPKRGSDESIRTSGGGDEFEDPLKNFERPTFDDELERSLAEDPVTVMEHTPFEAVTPDTAVETAMRKMVDLEIACLMVVDPHQGGKLVGIFSERDILTRVAPEFDRVKDKPIREVMTPDPIVVYETDTPAKALNLMSIGGFRHVPILDVDDKVIGILGPRRVTAYVQKFLT